MMTLLIAFFGLCKRRRNEILDILSHSSFHNHYMCEILQHIKKLRLPPGPVVDMGAGVHTQVPLISLCIILYLHIIFI